MVDLGMDREKILQKLKSFDEFCGENNLSGNLILIGGAALILNFGSSRGTMDIDSLDVGLKDFLSTMKWFDLEQFGISLINKDFLNLPDDFLDRIKVVKGFEHIGVYTLGSIDLILSKLGRGNPKDLEDCILIVEKMDDGEIERLKEIFEDWKIDYVGNERRLVEAFEFIMEGYDREQ